MRSSSQRPKTGQQYLLFQALARFHGLWSPPVKLTVEAAMLTDANDGTRVDGEAARRIDASEVLPLLQLLLTIVADLECDYERERDRIGGTVMDPDLRDKALRELDKTHQERRDPFLQRLRRIEEQLSP
jgi:hypothetical protein